MNALTDASENKARGTRPPFNVARGLIKAAFVLTAYLAHVFYLSTTPFYFNSLPDWISPTLADALQQIVLSDIVTCAGIAILLSSRLFLELQNRLRPVSRRKPLAPLFSLTGVGTDGRPRPPPWDVSDEQRSKTVAAAFALLVAYFVTAYVAAYGDLFLWENLIPNLYYLGFLPPPNEDIRLSMFVLSGHLLWVSMGTAVLSRLLRPFLPPVGRWMRVRWYPGANGLLPFPSSTAEAAAADEDGSGKGQWWLWAIGGYYVSAVVENVANAVNQGCMGLLNIAYLNASRLPDLLLANDLHPVASVLVAIGPCITGPLFEEVLYRGFCLASIASVPSMPAWAALILSSLIFALHHHNPLSLLPLGALGLLWSLIYLRSGNLAAPIVIHMLWNNRVFLSKLLPT